jgi:hypothetical protein
MKLRQIALRQNEDNSKIRHSALLRRKLNTEASDFATDTLFPAKHILSMSIYFLFKLASYHKNSAYQTLAVHHTRIISKTVLII